MHMDFWINYVGLTVRTGTAAVGLAANGVGMLGVGQQVGTELGQDLVEGWAKVGPELGQSWDRKLSQVANGSKFRWLNWGHGQAVAALQNE